MKPLATHLIALLALAGACAPLAAQQLTDAQRSAIRSACRSDYQRVCANVPGGTKDSLQCLVQHSDQVSAACRDALAPASPSTGAAPSASPNAAATASSATAAAAAPAAGSAPAAGGAPAAAPQATHPLSPREEATALRSKCSGDFEKLCSGVQPGGGRGAACLRAHASELTPACSAALSSAAPH